MRNDWFLDDMNERYPAGSRVKLTCDHAIYKDQEVNLTGTTGHVLSVWYYRDLSEYLVDVKFDAPPFPGNPDDEGSFLAEQVEVI